MTARRKHVEPVGFEQSPIGPPATTPELREQELVALAFDLAEKRLRDGSASAQETVHFLKLGTENAVLEREKLRKENILLEARTEQLSKNDRMEELFENAIAAFKGYSGEEVAQGDVMYD